MRHFLIFLDFTTIVLAGFFWGSLPRQPCPMSCSFFWWMMVRYGSPIPRRRKLTLAQQSCVASAKEHWTTSQWVRGWENIIPTFILAMFLDVFWNYRFSSNNIDTWHSGGASIANSKAIPWSLASDLSLMVRITDSGKKLTCLADLCCDAAQSEGVTEISIDDHDLTQFVKENSAAFSDGGFKNKHTASWSLPCWSLSNSVITF